MWLALLIAFAVSALLCGWIARRADSTWLDLPGHRSLHDVPVPRLGGLGIWLGVLAGGWVGRSALGVQLDPYWMIAGLLLWSVALLDDRYSIHPLGRLLVQCLAAVLTVFVSGHYVYWNFLGWLWPWVGVLVLIWGVNLYNFMDGIDGLAGSMAVVGFAAFGVLGWWQGDPGFALLCGLIVAANLGFLCLNFPPARIFMGDSGSTVLGFVMVSFGVLGWQRGLYPFWTPLLVFSPFWLDATVTLLRRLMRGERIWQAHREHLYQRWVRAGYSHRRVTGAYVLLMLLCGVTAVAWQVGASRYNESVLILSWGWVYLLLGIGSEKVLRRCCQTYKPG